MHTDQNYFSSALTKLSHLTEKIAYYYSTSIHRNSLFLLQIKITIDLLIFMI